MAIKKKKPQEGKPTIDLTGPKGNAFYLLGQASTFAKQLGYSEYEQNKLMEEMKAGDYEHLIEVFDEHFGMIVDLER